MTENMNFLENVTFQAALSNAIQRSKWLQTLDDIRESVR